MIATTTVIASPPATLLYNDECAVCRAIAGWVRASMSPEPGALIVRPIGDDPAALRELNRDLDIWDAYAIIHLLMPEGSMKVGGEAVAEVFRRLPNTAWFAGAFSVTVFGLRPFQLMLDGAYTLLADVRPLLGCESCGTSNALVRSLAAAISWLKAPSANGGSKRTPHHSPRATRDLSMQ